jgi:hypothetical protein
MTTVNGTSGAGPIKPQNNWTPVHTKKSEQIEHKPSVSPATPQITVDMSELEVKAAMNQALGFTRTTDADSAKMAKADAEFAKDPIAFAQKYTSAEVRANAEESGVEFDALATVLKTFSPERQAQVIEGFSQRNNSPRAFANEFLELFS